jgi:hypothetical protein
VTFQVGGAAPERNAGQDQRRQEEDGAREAGEERLEERQERHGDHQEDDDLEGDFQDVPRGPREVDLAGAGSGNALSTSESASRRAPPVDGEAEDSRGEDDRGEETYRARGVGEAGERGDPPADGLPHAEAADRTPTSSTMSISI